MRFRLFTLMLLAPLFVFCNKSGDPEDNGNNGNNGGDNPGQIDPPADDLAPQVKDGDVILVTNATVEKFLTDVSYPEHIYTETHIRDEVYAPTCPGSGQDKPQSYTIRWNADASAGVPTARLWEDDGWSRTYTSLAAGDSYLTISNMRPNAQYHYEVKAGDKVLTSGSFKTTGHVHQLFFAKNVRNCRDLGGWKTKDGTKTVKYRKIYRGGRLEPEQLKTSGKNDILAEGIRAQLDLRGTSDVLSESPFPDWNTSGYFCAPVIEEGYTQLLKDDQAKARQCFEFIAKCVHDGKPVYFHCSLGRDRTGTIAMMILGILGVNEGEISKEYELTQFAPNGWATSSGEKTKMTRLVDYKGAANYIWNTPCEGTEFADHMEAYLLSIGVAQATIDQFRSDMLE